MMLHCTCSTTYDVKLKTASSDHFEDVAFYSLESTSIGLELFVLFLKEFECVLHLLLCSASPSVWRVPPFYIWFRTA